MELFKHYEDIGDANSLERKDNIEKLITEIITFLDENPNYKLSDYIERVSLITDMDQGQASEERLTLMTLHSAKGLEFDYVYITGLENNILPIGYAFLETDLDEERRLLYVGMTRARKQLWLSYCDRRRRYNTVFYNGHSVFLSEIDPEYLEDKLETSFLFDHFKKDLPPLFEHNNDSFYPSEIKNNRLNFYDKKKKYPAEDEDYPLYNDMEYDDDDDDEQDVQNISPQNIEHNPVSKLTAKKKLPRNKNNP